MSQNMSPELLGAGSLVVGAVSTGAGYGNIGIPLLGAGAIILGVFILPSVLKAM